MSIETTGKALTEHWSWAAQKGLMNSSTANSLKAACTKVLSVLEDEDTQDVLSLDVDHAIQRFNNLCAKEFTPSSLETYASRFRKSLNLYREYVENPSGWKVPSRTLRVKKKSVSDSKGTDPAKNTVIDSGKDLKSNLDSNLIDYPYPLRKGVTARLALPVDLTSNEVRRINAFLMTLTNDFLNDEL